MSIAQKAAEAVAGMRRTFGIPVDPSQRGPVQLLRFIEECNLLHVTLPRLTRRVMMEHLLREGHSPDTSLTLESPDDLLAGAMLRMRSGGILFVGQCEPYVAESGITQERFTTQARHRFTAAHELGHFILHADEMDGFFADTKELIGDESENEKLSIMEREANRFAAELLMPTEVVVARATQFRKAFNVVPAQPFAYQLAAELLVSPEAMRNRLEDLKHLEIVDDR